MDGRSPELLEDAADAALVPAWEGEARACLRPPRDQWPGAGGGGGGGGNGTPMGDPLGLWGPHVPSNKQFVSFA
jgi:hypothetical protein